MKNMEIDYSKQHWDKGACPKVDCRKNSCKCGLKKVFLASALGDDSKDSPIAPKNGDYCNAIVVYEANGHIYIYSSEGIPTMMTADVAGIEELEEAIRNAQSDIVELDGDLLEETRNRESGDGALQEEIDAIKNSPDVVDIVATYAALQTYDTSKLGDNDIVRVLADEQHSGASTYYRWNKQSSTWTYIGEVGDYYTKGQVDTLLADKQDELTAGENISIAQVDNDLVISATDTTYSAFTGTDGQTAGAAGLVPAPATTDAGKFLKADGVWASISDGVKTLTTADYNYPTNNPLGVATWKLETGIYKTAGSVTVYPHTATSITPSKYELLFVSGKSSYVYTMRYNGAQTMALFSADRTSGVGQDEGSIFSDSLIVDNLTSTSTKLPLSANQGKALKALIDGLIISGSGAPTTSTVGSVGQLYEDTTNGKLYQCTSTSGGTYTWSEVGGGGGGGDTVYSTKTTSDSSDGGAVYIGNLDSSQVEQADPTATDNHYKYFWALPTDNTKIPRESSVNIMGELADDYGVTIGSGAYTATGHYYSTVIGGGASSQDHAVTAIGFGAKGIAENSVAIGRGTSVNTATYKNSVALGSFASATRKGEVNIGTGAQNQGYNGTDYRVIGGVHDGQNAHDAATVAQGNTLSALAPDSSTVGVLGQLWTDTTNMHTYQCTAISGSTYTWTQRW